MFVCVHILVELSYLKKIAGSLADQKGLCRLLFF